jgi:hypothetical protein
MNKTVALLSLAGACTLGTAIAQNTTVGQGPIQRVLLISIDGMHAVDYLNCSSGVAGVKGGAPYCPNMAALGQTAINYVAASTSKPSDSFPGLISIVTGGSPALTGIYYDVAYDRSLDAPATTTGNGLAGGPCTAGSTPTGTTTEYEEGIDIDQTKLNGGAPGAALTDGGIASIDPMRLVRNPANGCAPVYPWQFVRTNSIFSVIHAAGGYAAWSDKHPAYSAVASGIGPSALDDFYGPEINSTVIPLPGVVTPTGTPCTTIPDPTADLSAWTNGFHNIQCYDTLKVNAIVNEIDGKDHLGLKTTKVPNVFGMNFQAVSVGQKLIINKALTGGYIDGSGTPSALLTGEIEFVDASIGKFVGELKAKGLYDTTLIIITAKHGQSPIDPHLYDGITGKPGGSSPATVLDNAGFIPFSEAPSNPTGIGPTEDDVSLLWLKSSSDTDAGVKLILQNTDAVGLGQIFFGPALALNYNDPTVDPRSPDIIVTPNVGVTYSGSKKKQAEHGGFAHDDTNVMLLVSNPNIVSQTVRAAVGTAQVAPSILTALGINPNALQAVQSEGTPILPLLPVQPLQ